MLNSISLRFYFIVDVLNYLNSFSNPVVYSPMLTQPLTRRELKEKNHSATELKMPLDIENRSFSPSKEKWRVNRKSRLSNYNQQDKYEAQLEPSDISHQLYFSPPQFYFFTIVTLFFTTLAFSRHDSTSFTVRLN